jgi:septum formation protein
MRLILASASPRRAELLTAASFQFETRTADIDESPRSGESAEQYTVRVAREKAHKVKRDLVGSPAIVLAADTEVVVDGTILGKPVSHEDARRMLKLMAGRTHEVLTAVVVLSGSSEQRSVVSTLVNFLPLSDDEIEVYVRTGESMGKAGAYAIQGYAARFIDRIDGSWSNVVGLPIHAVHQLIMPLLAG